MPGWTGNPGTDDLDLNGNLTADNLTIVGSASVASLATVGQLSVNGNATVSGRLFTAQGSAGGPAFSFATGSFTGIYFPGSRSVAVSVGSVQGMLVRPPTGLAGGGLEDTAELLVGDNIDVPSSGHDANQSDVGIARVSFWYDAAHRRLHTRNLVLNENSDPVDLRLQRYEGVQPNGTPVALPAANITGQVGGAAWGSNQQFSPYVAAMWFAVSSTPTGSTAPGEVILLTTNLTSMDLIRRITVGPKGTTNFHTAGAESEPTFYLNNDEDTGPFWDGANQFAITAGGNRSAVIHGTVATEETALLLRYVRGGSPTFQRVTIGNSDSGGVGFRVLRVPN